MLKDIRQFIRSYRETILWQAVDYDGEPLDHNFTVDDFTPASNRSIRSDCCDFLRQAIPLIEQAGGSYDRAGHDFALTRNRHGAGFWDGDWPPSVGDQLTQISHDAGGVDVYPADDSWIIHDR